MLIEGEFHAVWKDRGGALHDIAPAPQGKTQRLFLADPGRRYEGRQVNNVRRPLTEHPTVRRFIAANDRLFEVMNRGQRAYEGIVSVPNEELAPVLKEIADAYGKMVARQVGRNEPCPCGSGKKYKRCCGA